MFNRLLEPFKQIKIRKNHQCFVCCRSILKKRDTTAIKGSVEYNGKWINLYTHNKCIHQIEKEVNIHKKPELFIPEDLPSWFAELFIPEDLPSWFD